MVVAGTNLVLAVAAREEEGAPVPLLLGVQDVVAETKHHPLG